VGNTYTQIDIQLVFAVQGRRSLIQKTWKNELYQYITGIVQNHKHKMLQINGMPDHIHIFIGYNPNHRIPDLVEEIKTSSNKYIKEMGWCPQQFNWQSGYGAFSYNKSQRSMIINYIENQEAHHQKKSFQTEYMELLEEFEVAYREEYLFEFF
jgi:putative transposase